MLQKELEEKHEIIDFDPEAFLMTASTESALLTAIFAI
jgi:hypothetical protein